MKKSKFLQSSKDMLSRSFNPTKCKTSLRLAASRLKLLRNKKEVQVNQMKREIAQLLETGQDQTAKIRVEHVIREEKMMSAYDLLEIYCELSIERLPIIDKQKNCPIDMKEAITSLVFASPRCGDVPELLDIRKQFSAKYGKEFISAAIELRPQCGVSRLLVEKLSATAPDGQAKINILSAIAGQHNIKWDPKAFDEKHSGGPSSIMKENEVYSNPPHLEAAEVHAPPKSNMNSSPLNSVQQNVNSSIGAENLPLEPKSGPSGKEMPQLFQGDTNSSHINGNRWNMEFKDAASAAQAAAESAERASYAARAAAELSSHGRISGQYSAESPRSDAFTSKDDRHGTPPNLNSFGRASEASANKSSSEYTRLGSKQVDNIKPSNPMPSTRSDAGGSEKYSQEVSFKSKPSADDGSSYNVVLSVNEYTEEYSSDEVSESEMVIKKQSSSYETQNENNRPQKVENLGEGRVREEKSSRSSYSQSGLSDYVNVFANSEEPKFETVMGEDPSVSFNETSIDDEATHTSSHDFGTATFDQSDTDDDDDPGLHREQDLEFHLHSLGQKSPERTSINTDTWNARSSSTNTVEFASRPSYFMREESFPDNSGSSTLREDSKVDNFAPARFDDSDGPSSESDVEERNSTMVEDSRDLSHEQNERGRLVNVQFEEETIQSVGSGSPSKNKGSLAFRSKQFSVSSDDELSSSNKVNWKRSQVNVFDAYSSEKFGDRKPSAKQPALAFDDSPIELNSDNDSDHESGVGLNFGKLTGGLRHKGHNHLPFLKNQSDASSPLKKDPETTATNTSSASDLLPEHRTTSTTQNLRLEGDSDSSEEEEYLRKSTGLKQPRSTATVKAKLAQETSNSVFYSDDSDLDEHSPREPVTRKSHLRGGISRRTKASSSSSTKISNSKMHLRSEALDSDGLDRNPTTSYKTETPKRHESNRRNSDTQEKYEQPISGVSTLPTKSNTWESTEKPAEPSKTSVMKLKSKERLESRIHDSDNRLGRQPFYADDNEEEFRLGKPEQKPSSGKTTSTTVQQSKIPQKSTVQDLANSKLKAKTDASVLSGTSNTSTPGKPSLEKDDSTKKASHVHPKLPDYDSLVQSLRINRS